MSTRWQRGRVQPSSTVCLMVCQPERIVYQSGDCESLGCPLTSAGPLSVLAAFSRLWPSVRLFTAIWYPYSVSAVRPQETQHSEKAVDERQRWMMFRGYFVKYCKANLSFSLSFTHFYFFPVSAVDTVISKSISLNLKCEVWLLRDLFLHFQLRFRGFCTSGRSFYLTASQVSFVLCFIWLSPPCIGVLQATWPKRPPRAKCVCTHCVPAGRAAMAPALPTLRPVTRATAVRVTGDANARWLSPCSTTRTATASASAPCSPSASVSWLF